MSQIKNGWNLSKVEDCLIKTPRYSKLKKSEYLEIGKFPVIDQGAKFISGYSNDEEKIFKDIPVTLFGDHTRILKYIKNHFVAGADGTQLLIPNEDWDRKYFYYSLKNLRLKNYGYERHFKFLKEEIISVPPLPTQQRIASILSAFDDLIENNTRRIKILEEMAQAIYTEWFVRFRFPGHEDISMVDSGTEFGEIPEGWEVKKFVDDIDVMSGGTPKTKIPEYWGGGIPFFTPKDASHNFYCLETEKYISELGLSKCNSKLYPKNTVFITARGTVGKCNLAPHDMAMNQSCYALSGVKKGISNLYIYLTILKLVEGLKKQAIGGVFDTITVATFERLDFLIPKKEIINLFDKKIAPFFEQSRTLIQQNQKLRETRDLLLPRLVSGEIEIQTKK